MQSIINFKQYAKAIILGSFIAFTLSSCGDDNGYDPNEERSISGLTRADVDIEENLASFSFGMLEKMAVDAEEEGFQNVVYSPLSVNSMLSMTALGAEGKTLDEIIAATGLDGVENAQAAFAEHYRLLFSQIGDLDRSAVLRMASGIWSLPSVSLNSDYQRDVAEYFKAQSWSADLGSPDGASIINGWIERNTGGMVRNLYTPNSDAMIVLANAMYFEGRWRHPFDKSKTVTDDFLNADGEVVKVNMMEGDVEADVYFDLETQTKYMTLQFGNKSFMVDVYLTDGEHPASALIPVIARNMWRPTAKKSFGKVNVKMPRFEIENNVDITPYLEQCGITRLISLPELGKMTDSPVAGLSVHHGAAFKVAEDGVKAAAATVENMISSPGPFAPDPDPLKIKVNRPFVFAVYEASSGAILTIGCVNRL